MPSWLVNILIPYAMPAIIAMLSPILSEYVKKAYEYLAGHLPPPVMLALVTGVSEGLNAASQWLAGASLPPGMAPLLAVFINTLMKYVGKNPPTPGMPQSTLPDPAK